jgi:sarcosine oxidase
MCTIVQYISTLRIGQQRGEGAMGRVAVVGAGVVGLACAGRLALDGHDVDLFERWRIGHERASSHGDVRMRVPAGFPTGDYVARGQLAARRWRELERHSERRILTDVGCLFWGSAAEPLSDALRDLDVVHQVLTPGEVKQRWGLNVPGPATWQPEAGYVDAGAALEALAEAAVVRGVRVHEGSAVSLAGGPEEAVIAVDGARWAGDVVVVAAGAWSRSLLAAVGVALPVRSTTQTVAYFDVSPDEVPGLVQYGAPDPYACPVPGVGLKAAFHAPGPPSASDEPAEVDPATVSEVQRWVSHLVGGPAPVLGARACRYTWTDDESFVIERRGAVIAVSACSGHGFQYAPDTADRVAAAVAG